MAKAGKGGQATKITFGKRKGGSAKKTHNKHNSKSTYARNNASR